MHLRQASAQHPGGVLADANAGTTHLANSADEVLEHSDICRVFNKTPHVPIEWASTGSTLDAKLQAKLLFLVDFIV